MKLRTRLDWFSTALLSALGTTQLVACGGTAVTAGEDGGSSGRPSGAAGATTGAAGTPPVSAGGTSSGGGSSGGADTVSAGASSTAGAGASAPVNPYPCQKPVDLGNGFIQCDGFKHRPAEGKCTSHVPRPEPIANPTMLGCSQDADCTDKPYGWCGYGQGNGGFCNYGCVVDSDCGSGWLCECAEPVGRCVRAECATDAACGPNLMCRGYDASGGCGEVTYSCQTAADTCGSDLDCSATNRGTCRLDASGSFRCFQTSCAIGRPFLIEGEQRQARAATRADWAELSLLPKLRGLPELLRARLAEQWTRVALLEHASIAAFARFSLQLLSLGAPATLIELSTAAMVDETRHAKACFAMASHYGAMPLGPGHLAVERSLDESALEAIVLNAIREGCIGETLAAIEAREAAEHASDPAVRELLSRISEDETRHAELAYRFVKWALSVGGPELERAVQREFNTLATEARPARGALAETDAELLQQGFVPSALRQVIRAQAIAEVILPCARALFSESSLTRSAAQLSADSTRASAP